MEDRSIRLKRGKSSISLSQENVDKGERKVKTITIRLLTYALITMFIASACLSIVRPAHAAGTVALVNAADGSSDFNFTSPSKNVGDTFVVNVTIASAVDLGTWQVAIQWDSSLLGFVSMVMPTDHIFASKSPIGTPPSATPGLVIMGALVGPGVTGFTGSGRMAQLTLNITKAVGTGETVQTDLSYEGMLSDTFLLDSQGNDITTNYAFNIAHYKYSGPPGPVTAHDVAVTNVLPAATIVAQNSSVSISVTVANIGSFTETFAVGVTANGTNVDANQTVTNLAAGSSTTLTFVWNTTSFATGKYVIVAVAGSVAGETNTADNTLSGPMVSVRGVTLLGDVNNDGVVNMKDVTDACAHFGAFNGTPRYDPDIDVNGDGRIDMRDILAIVLNFGKRL
jgi:hypothetical protein